MEGVYSDQVTTGNELSKYIPALETDIRIHTCTGIRTGLGAEGEWPAAFVPVAWALIMRISVGGGALWVREKPSAAQGQEAAQKSTHKRTAAFGASQPDEGERTGLRTIPGRLLNIKSPRICSGFALKSPVVDCIKKRNLTSFSRFSAPRIVCALRGPSLHVKNGII